MTRPTGVTAAAILLFLGALMLGMLLIGAQMLSKGTAQVNPLLMIFTSLLYPVGAIVVGIGLLKMQTWARQITICGAVLGVLTNLLVFLAVGLAMIVGVMKNPGSLLISLLVLIPIGIIALGIPIGFLVYFTRSHVIEAFYNDLPKESAAFRRPFGVSVISTLLLVGGAAMVSFVFSDTPAALFGFWPPPLITKGWFTLCLVLSIYMGLGIFKLDQRAYFVTVAWHLMALVNVLLNMVIISPQEFMEKTSVIMPEGIKSPLPPEALFWVSMGIGLATIIPILVYLFIARRHFESIPPPTVQAQGSEPGASV